MLTLVSMKLYPILIIILLFSVFSCKKRGSALKAPEIAFAGFSHDSVFNGDPKDTVLISLRYTMAADAIGNKTQPTQVYLKDSRDQTEQPFSFPEEIANNLPDLSTPNINGTITLRLPVTQFMTLRPSRPNGDTLHYNIYMKDKTGTQSNTIETPFIYILP